MPVRLYWLGKGSLFQTFDDLDSVIDKETAIKEIRQVLDNDFGKDAIA